MTLFNVKYYFVLLFLFCLFNFSFGQNETKLSANDGALNDYYGQSVFNADSLLIVGSYQDNDSGSVYIYEKIANSWSLIQKLTANDGQPGDHFGYDISYSGAHIIVGAPMVDDNGYNAGAVYVFEHNGVSWFQLDKLTASDGLGGETFGFSLDISDNVLIAGAKSDNDNGTYSGSAYIFRYDGFSWLEEDKLLASNGNDNDLFGFDVKIENTKALIGAYKADTNGTYSGAAYLFEYIGSNWDQTKILVADDGGSNEFFGHALDIYDTTIVVGAYKHGSGAVYVYNYNGGLWSQSQKLSASDGAANDEFGVSLSLYKYRLAVGAIKDDEVPNNSGSVYTFQFNGSVWEEDLKINNSDAEANDYFGNSLSMNRNQLFCGVKNDDDNGNQSGSAYIYELCDLSSSINKKDISCFGGNDSWAKAIYSGGDIGYAFSWSNGNTTDSIFNLISDSFILNILDSNSCQITDTVFINEPADIQILKDSSDVDCEGNANAWCKVSVSGGTQPYTYLWSNGNNTDSIGGLIEATYHINIADSNSCFKSDSFIIDTRSRLSLSKDSADLRCYQLAEGLAVTIPSNGVPPYTYSWSNLSLSDSNKNLLAGKHYVTVTDSLACIKSDSFNLTEPSALSIIKDSVNNKTCFGDSFAWAKVIASGGTGTYTYAWSNLETTDSISELSAGTYKISVSDSNICMIVDSFNIEEPAELIILKDSQNIVCIRDSNAYAKVSVSGGIGSYTFLWNDSSALDSIGGLSNGNFYVSVTDDSSCIKTDSFKIAIENPFIISARSDTFICYGDSVGLNVFFIDSGTTPYSFLWTPTLSLNNALIEKPNAAPQNSTLFTVSVTDSRSCVSVDSVMINVNPELSLSLMEDTFICHNDTILLSPSISDSGSGSLSYLWTPTAKLSNALIESPYAFPETTRQYRLEITDSGQCKASDSITINVNPELSASLNNDTLICYGDSTNLLATIENSGTIPNSYHWQPTSSLDDALILNPRAYPLISTKYIFNLSDDNNCSFKDSVYISVNNRIEVDAGNDTLICYGDSMEIPGIMLYSGTPPLSYLWSPTPSLSNAVALKPKAGPTDTTLYHIEVTDSNFCKTNDSIRVLVNPILSISIANDTLICYGDSIILSVDSSNTIGLEPHIVSWSPSATLSSNNILEPGAFPLDTTTYVLSITDANQCQTKDTIIVNVNPILNIDTDNDTLICFGDSIGLNSLTENTLGTPPLSFVWSPSAHLDNNNLPEPVAFPTDTTKFILNLSDASGCTAQDSIIIMVNPEIAVDLNSDTLICFGEYIQMAPNITQTGTAPYTSLWNMGSYLSDSLVFEPLANPSDTLSFRLTLTDLNNCSAQDSIMVNVIHFAINAGMDTAICIYDTIQINLDTSVVPGISPITYSWASHSSLSDPSIHDPNVYPTDSMDYTILATDDLGCIARDTIRVNVVDMLVDIGNDTSICIGAGMPFTPDTSTFEANSPYIYGWSPSGNVDDVSLFNPVVSSNVPDTFTLKLQVTDSLGCIVYDSINVNIIDLTVDAGNDTLICYGDSIQLKVDTAIVPGIMPYSYSWSSPDSLKNTDIFNPKGLNRDTLIYTVTVTDMIGCTATDSRTINVTPPLIVDPGNDTVICFGQYLTVPALVSHQGSGGLNYLWSNHELMNDASLLSPTVLPVDTSTLTITVTDATTCTFTDSFIIFSNPLITALADKDTGFICYGDSVFFNVTAPYPGTPPYTYFWSSNEPISSPSSATTWSSPTQTNNIFIQITDASNCSAYDSLSVNVNPPLSINAGNDTIICYQDSLIIPAVITGSGASPISKIWSPFGLVNDPNKLNPTVYPTTDTTMTVNITDAKSCTASDQIHISINLPLSLNADADSFICYLDSAFLSTIIVDPGTAPYTYLWSDSGVVSNINSSSSYAKPLLSQGFSVTVTDSVTCTATAITQILVSPALIINAGVDKLICYGDSLDLNASIVAGGLAPASLNWSPGIGLSDSTILKPSTYITQSKTYEIVITDAHGCNASDLVNITLNPELDISISGDGFICYSDSANLNVIVNNTGAGSLTYSWSPGNSLDNADSTSVTATPINTTNYQLLVTDASACTANTSHVLDVNPILSLNMQNDTLSCFEETFELNVSIVDYGTPPLSYSWSPGTYLSDNNILRPDVTPSDTTTYQLIVTDSNQCQAMSQFLLNVNPQLKINTINDTSLCFGDSVFASTTISHDGSPPLTYVWSPNNTIDNNSFLSPTLFPTSNELYIISVADNNNCTAKDTLNILVDQSFIADINADTFMCFEDSSLLIIDLIASGTPPYTYSWSHDSLLNVSDHDTVWAKPESITLFEVSITDSFNCTAIATHQINVNPPLSIEMGNDTIICYGDSLMLPALITGSGSGSNITSWSPITNINDPQIINPTASPLDTTEYTLSITDIRQCETSEGFTLKINPRFEIFAGNDTLICFRDSLNLSAQILYNGAGSLSFDWNPGIDMSDSSILNTVLNTTTSGYYNVLATDITNCSVSDNFYVDVNPELSFNITGDSLLCFDDTSSLNILFTSPGTPPYSYAWSDPASLSSPNDSQTLAFPTNSTDYVVSLTDANNCQSTSQYFVFANNALAIDAGTDTLICFGDSLLINAQLSASGSGPISYNWLPVNHIDNSSSLLPSVYPDDTTTYHITATDSMQCKHTDSIIIKVNPILSSTISGDSFVCYGDSFFVAANVINTGTAPYYYKWTDSNVINNPSGFSSNGFALTTQNITLSITDASMCTYSISKTIEVNPPLNVIAGSDTFICFGDSAYIGASVSASGSGNINYLWEPATNLSDPVSALTFAFPSDTQIFLIQVTDNKQCTSKDSLIVMVNNEIILNAGNDTLICYGDSIELNSSVNVNGASFLWTPTVPLNNALIEDPIAFVLDTSIFEVAVTDAQLCSVSDNMTVYTTPPISTGLINDTLICYGDSFLLDPGINYHDMASLSFLWMPTSNLSDATTQNPLSWPNDTTSYRLKITGANQCTYYDSISVFTSPFIPLDAGNDTLICPNDSLTLSASIDQNAQFIDNLVWSHPNYLSNAYILNPNTKPTSNTVFNIDVTDIYGCFYNDSIMISLSPSLDINIGNDTLVCYGDTLQAFANIVNPGAGLYQYSWTPSNTLSNTGISNPYLFPLQSTSYELIITDNNNCTASDQMLVSANPQIKVDAGGSAVVCHNDSTQLPANMLMPGSPPYTILWIPTNGLDNAQVLKPMASPSDTSLYTVFVVDQNNCSTQDDIMVYTNPPLDVYAGNDTLICHGLPLQLNASITTGQSYLDLNTIWTPTANLSNAVVLNPFVSLSNSIINYKITLTDSNNCTAEDDITIVPNPLLSLDLGADTSLCINSSFSPAFSFSSPSTFATSYYWTSNNDINNDSIASPTINIEGTDQIILSLTDDKGCSVNDTLAIYNLPLLDVLVRDDTIICEGDSLPLNVTFLSSGTPPHQFEWNNTSFISNPFISDPYCFPGAPSTFTVSVTDNNNCLALDSVNVVFNPSLKVELGNDTFVCSKDSILIPTMLIGSGTPPYIISWDDPSVLNDSLSLNPFVSPNFSSLLSLILTDNNLCRSEDSVFITVHPNLAVEVLDDTLICIGDTVSLSLIFKSQGTSPYQYHWSPVSYVSDSTIYNPGVFPPSSTIFNVVVTDSNNCIATDDVNINVSTFAPKSINGPTNVYHLDTFSYSTLHTSGSSYNWFVEGGNIVSGNGSNTISIAWGDEGLGKISYVEVNSLGCVNDSISIIINISWGTGISHKSINDLFIYPNPTNDYFYIQSDIADVSTYKLEIFNALGQSVMYKESLLNKPLRLSLSELGSNGVYLVSVSKNLKRSIFKLILMSEN